MPGLKPMKKLLKPMNKLSKTLKKILKTFEKMASYGLSVLKSSWINKALLELVDNVVKK